MSDVDPSTRTRLIADLPGEDADRLVRISEDTGFNKVTTLVRAIRVLDELLKADAAGGKIIITYPDRSREKLVLK